jgi:hypothetical protein
MLREQLGTGVTTPARSWMGLRATASEVAFVGVPGITISARELEVVVNQPNVLNGTVVDFSASPLQVATGPGRTLALAMDGADGALTRATTHATLDVLGFFRVEGDFAFESKTTTVKLADNLATAGVDESATPVTVDLLTVGASNLDAFAGVGGGTDSALGLNLAGVEFGLALMSDHATPTRKWTALQASAASAAFIGVDGLTVSGETLAVQVNRAATDGSVVDFAADTLDIATGPSSTLTLDMDGDVGALLRATGHLNLDVFGFFQAEGDFAIEKKTAQVTLSDLAASNVTVDLLTIGASDLDAFAGIHGGTDDALGLALNDVDFALALMHERVAVGAPAGRSWTSLKANAGSVGFVGIDGIGISATDLFVEINRASVPTGPVVDHAASPLVVATGPTSTLDLDMAGSRGALLRAGGTLDIDLFGFVQLHGDFAFEKSSTEVVLSDASVAQVDLLTLGAKTPACSPASTAAPPTRIGLQLTHVDFGLAMMSDKAAPTRKWTAMRADVGTAGFIGIDAFTLQATGLQVQINKAATDGTVVDFLARPMSVSTSGTTTLALNMDGAQGDLLRATGHLDIGVGGFFSVGGDFGIEKRTQLVTLSDGSEATVNLLSIGGHNVNAFAGINGGTTDALGLSLGQVDFAVALMSDVKAPTHKFTSVQATAGLAAFIGVEGLTVEARDMAVNINKGVLVAAVPASDVTVNTKLHFDVAAATTSVQFGKGGSSANANVGASLSNAQVIANLKAAIGALTGVGAANVLVTGTRLGGYTIEFVGTLAGTDVAGITAAVGAATATTGVTTTVASSGGVSELKQVTIDRLRDNVPAVDVSVSQVVAAALGISEIKSIIFTTPYSTTGSYEISAAGRPTQTVVFRQNDIENNKAAIRNAIAALFGVTSGITVGFDANYKGGHRYDITFSGTLASQDIGDITITESLSGDILPLNKRQGSVATGETQRVTIASSTATGTFQLSLNYLTLGTFTTGDIAFGADAATVQAALLAASNGSQALASQGAITVTKNGESYDIAFGGGFAGRDLKNLQVALAVDSAAPGGSFTIEYAGQTTAAIAYSADGATMAANIQAALEALAGIGAGNVLVSVDAAASDATHESFSVAFQGALADQDIANFTTHFGNLVNATASPFEVRAGHAVVAEEQQVVVTTTARAASYTLALTHNGSTYTTAPISITGTLADAQAALDAAFAGLSGADVEVVSFTGKRITVRFGGSLAGVDVAALVATATADAGTADLQVVQTGSTVHRNAVAQHDVVIDYSAGHTALTVATGSTTSFTFDMDGARGALLEASGTLKIDVFGFLQVEADFAIQKDTRTVQLADTAGTSVVVDALTIGASHAQAFAGINGGTADELGFRITDGNFALALLSSQADPTRKWTALKADVASAGLVGFDFMTVHAADISVEITRAGRVGDAVIDFEALPVTIATGGGTSVDIDFSGDRGALTAVSIGRATLAISDYIYVSGGFYFEQGAGTQVDVVTGLPDTYPATMPAGLRTGLGKIAGLSADHSRIENLAVNTTLLSATDVDIFVGLGPYFIDTNGNGLFDATESLNPDAFGITLNDIDFGMAMMSSTLAADPDRVIPKFTALKVLWDGGLNIDWDFFKFQADHIAVTANLGGAWVGATQLAKPYVDFTSSFGAAGLAIPAGEGTINLDFDRAKLGVSIGHALLNVGDFFQIEGSFAFEKSSAVPVDVATGLPAIPTAGTSSLISQLRPTGYLSTDNGMLEDLPMDVVSFGASNVRSWSASTSDPFFTLDDIDIGFAVFRASPSLTFAAQIPRMYAMKAHWANPLDVDWGVLQLQVQDLDLKLNQGANWTGQTFAPHIDFVHSFGAGGFEVATGGDSIGLDFQRTTIGVEVGHALIRIDDFFYIEGGFALEKSKGVDLTSRPASA